MDDPELDAERMRGGYISVRDVGFVDDDGYLHVVDRADDMIISGGVNVYPAETEIALNAHPRVDEATVLGVPDPKWGQRIVAAVVPKGDVSEDELIGWAKENSAYAAVPKEIRFMDSLPRNDIGKVDKKRLTEEWGT
jgi:acyl-CoA synthetase (AMP-forming)/AMP-acid ligase II